MVWSIFYYGQLVHHGQLKGDPRVLARSRGVSDDMVAVAQRVALLPAHPDLPLSAWGLLRSREVPFIFVQAQKTPEGQTMRHFVFLPPDIPRGLQGAVGELQVLVQERLPTYEMLGDALPQLEFKRPPQRSANEQVNDLLELMTLTGNNTRVLELLLSAIIEGRPLVVRRAPSDPKSRYDFVEGLLTLLPPSTRFSISFALYDEAASAVQAQISFAEDAESGAVVYNWPDHRVEAWIRLMNIAASSSPNSAWTPKSLCSRPKRSPKPPAGASAWGTAWRIRWLMPRTAPNSIVLS